ncbi:acyl carrier protein [Mycobacteroides abscessus subsp. abscessus]|nr:acyl carrier protein [Mycobacteroides abscessus subsp. abscessus]
MKSKIHKITEIFSRHIDVEQTKINLEDSLYEDLGLDSTSLIDVLLELEKELEIELDFEEMEPKDLENLKSLIFYLERLNGND